MADLDDLNRSIKQGNLVEGLGDLAQIAGQAEIIRQQEQISSALKAQQKEQARIAALPKCPFCKKPCENEATLCSHCRKEIAYIKKTVTKAARFVVPSAFAEEVKGDVIQLLKASNSRLRAMQKSLSKLDGLADAMRAVTAVWRNRYASLSEVKSEDLASPLVPSGCAHVFLVPVAGGALFVVGSPIACIAGASEGGLAGGAGGFLGSIVAGLAIAAFWGSIWFFLYGFLSGIEEKKNSKVENIVTPAVNEAKKKLEAFKTHKDPVSLYEEVRPVWKEVCLDAYYYRSALADAQDLAGCVNGLRIAVNRKVVAWPSVEASTLDGLPKVDHGVIDYTQILKALDQIGRGDG